MKEATRHLLEEALQLPSDERLELLAELQEKIEEPEMDPAWVAEIERRAATDTSHDIPWPEVVAKLDAKYGRK